MLKLSVIGATFLACAGMTFATTTTSELKVCVMASCTTILDNGSGDSNPANGVVSWSGTAGNWSVSFTTGTSGSPSSTGINGLDLGSLVATCNTACAANPLVISYSDINFTSVITGLEVSYSDTVTGGGTGATTAEAYLSKSNTIFDESGTSAGPVTAGATAVTATAPIAGGAGPSPYSLTLVETFTAAGNGAVRFSSDGAAVGVPEPGAIMLFGTVLLLCVAGLRRRLAN